MRCVSFHRMACGHDGLQLVDDSVQVQHPARLSRSGRSFSCRVSHGRVPQGGWEPIGHAATLRAGWAGSGGRFQPAPPANTQTRASSAVRRRAVLLVNQRPSLRVK